MIKKEIKMRPFFTMKIREEIVFFILLSSSISIASNVPFNHVVIDNSLSAMYNPVIIKIIFLGGL